MKFNKGYFIITVLLFATEVLIALFIHDRFIRPYAGDVLVVILIYCFIRSFFPFRTLPVALFTLVFSFVIEFLQYYNIIEKLGLENSTIARTVLGNSFAWLDLVAYVAGIVIVLGCEWYLRSSPLRRVS